VAEGLLDVRCQVLAQRDVGVGASGILVRRQDAITEPFVEPQVRWKARDRLGERPARWLEPAAALLERDLHDLQYRVRILDGALRTVTVTPPA
jgi:hypothetical protein